MNYLIDLIYQDCNFVPNFADHACRVRAHDKELARLCKKAEDAIVAIQTHIQGRSEQ